MSNARGVANYHAAVDGLRAIAVISVVFYHIGLAWLPGGYVGVDVFFVISGFLIIGHIVDQRTRGVFRYREFWARRVVRILPPYLLVVTATLLASIYFLVTPDEVEALGEQAMYSAAMLANHHFLSLEGYFNTAAESKPLLHLWSLSVEEQFYLVTPVLVGLFWALGERLSVAAKRWVGWVLAGAIFLGSLYLCIRYTSASEKNYAFYVMPLRAWEFLAGGMTYAALPWLRRLPQSMLSVLGLLGAGMICAAVFGFDHGIEFPSYYAALPAIGSALVIGTTVAAPSIGVSRLLAIRPMVWIGLLSYSWYLWHWPVIVFIRLYNFDRLPLAAGLAAAAGSLALAYLTYRWLETPARLRWQRFTRTAGLRVIGVGILACGVIALAGYAMATKVADAAAARVPPAYARGKGTSGGACGLHVFNKKRCKEQMAAAVGRPPKRIGVLLGDSHARAMRTILVRRAAMNHGTYLVSFLRGGCNPIYGVVRHWVGSKARDHRCRREKAKALEVMREGKVRPEFAIIGAFWSNYPTLSEDGETIPLDQRELYVRRLRATLDELEGVGIKRILVIGAVPVMPTENSTGCVLRAQRYKKDVAKVCGSTDADYEERNGEYVRRVEMAIAGRPNVRMIDPRTALCENGVCSPLIDGVVVYRDDDHVNDGAAERIYRTYREEFDWVFGGDTYEN